MEMRGQPHAPAALVPVKSHPCPLYRRLGEPQSGYGHFGEQRNPLPLFGIETPFLNCPAHNLVTATNDLFLLQHLYVQHFYNIALKT